jgi:hypothetical protein
MKSINYSHEPTQTKEQVGWCIVWALLVHGWSMGKHRLTRLTRTQTWGKPPPSPLYYTLCLVMGPAPKCHFVSGVPKFSKLGLPQLWGPVTLCADLWLKWGLKQSCNPCQELFNNILHTTWTQGNRGNFRILVVAKQIANLTLIPFFWP